MFTLHSLVQGKRIAFLVSIPNPGVGRCFGSQPRAKVSMMSMRPPQQGHGFGSVSGSSSVAPAADRMSAFGRGPGNICSL